MRKLFMMSLLVLLVATPAFASDTYVGGYTRKDGTYVQPHYRSRPDGNPYNNYSTRGNVNPYTGARGTQDPFNNSGTSWDSNTQPTHSSNPYDHW